MGSRCSKARIYAALGSIVVHALVAMWIGTREAPRAAQGSVVAVEFTLAEPLAVAPTAAPAPSGAPVEATAPRASSAPAPTAVHATTPRSDPARAVEEPTSAGVESASAGVDAASAAAEPASAAPPTGASATVDAPRDLRALDLSPLAAALTLRDALASRGRCEAKLADAAAACEGTGDAGTARQGSASGDVRAELAGIRKELQLTLERDGSYGFNGPSFRATIARDGNVTFADKIQDLNTFVERHLVGAQVNTSEKRRFMESTAALRERLAAAAEEQNQHRASIALQQALQRILNDQGSSLAQKRRTLFDAWDDCAGDTSGRLAQAAIEAFIREHLPEGSALGYSATELTRLNRARVSRHPFDPYAKPDAGVRPG